MFVFLFLCIYTNPATGCYMNKTILFSMFFNILFKHLSHSLSDKSVKLNKIEASMDFIFLSVGFHFPSTPVPPGTFRGRVKG